ncbi:MAG: PH domain-containing protein [Acutalibacteraceae bacterium]
MKNNTKKYKGAHPYTIWAYLGDSWFVLLIPLVQNILYAPKSIVAIITNFGINILFVILLFTAIILESTSIKYQEKEASLYAKKGFILKRRADIPYNSIHSVTVQKNIFPMLFNARKIYINTPAIKGTSGDYSLYVSKKKEKALKSNIFSEKSLDHTYNGGSLRVIVMSAFWSNSLTGLLIFVPILNKISNIFGEQYGEILYQSFDISDYIISVGVPPVLAGLATALLIGWCVAFVVQLCRYGFFKSQLYGDNIVISRGVFNRLQFATKKDKINAITIKQSIPMLILNLKTVCIHTIGAGLQKGDKSVLMPAERSHKIKRFINRIFKTPKRENQTLSVRKRDIMAYLWFPIYSILGTLLLGAVLIYLGYFNTIVRIPYFVVLTILIYWLFFRMYCHSKAGISISEEAVQIDYFKRLNRTTTIIPYDKIQFLELYQGPPQRIFKTAHLKVYIYSQHKEYFKIKHLKYKELSHIVDEIEDRISSQEKA